MRQIKVNILGTICEINKRKNVMKIIIKIAVLVNMIAL